MRLIKMFGLAAVAAVAAMALVGATSASALNTELCTAHSALTCGAGNDANTVSFLGSGELLSDLVDILCLDVHGTATPLALANPQSVHILLLDYLNCGTTSSHNNCDILVLELPLANLNKTGLDAGTLTAENGLVTVICENIDIFGIDIECNYDATGLQFSVGAQHLTASNTKVDKTSGSLCPEESFVDGLLETTGGNRYILA